jgi:hypothetical protein
VNGGYVVYFKEAAGGESGTLSLTADTSGNTQIARMFKVSGAGVTASDFVAGTAETESADPQVNAGVGSPGVNGAMVVFLGATQDCITNNETDGLGSVSGGTNVGAWTTVSNGSTGGLDAGMGTGTAIQSTAAATGNITGDWQASQATYAGISYTYAVKPAPLTNSQSESVTATEQLSSKVVAAASLAESVMATELWDSETGAAGLSDSQMETVTATEVEAFQLVASASQSESVTATETESTTGSKVGLGLSESATATDAIQLSSVNQAAGQSESATATDSYQAYVLADETQTESVTATDSWLLSGGDTTQTESVTASEAWGFALRAGVGQSESVTATDAYASASIIGTGRFLVWDGASWV